MSDLPRLLLCCFDVVPAPTAISRRMTEYVKGLSDRYQVVVLSVKTPDHTHIERYQGARLLRVPVGSGDLAARAQAFDRAVRRQLDSEEYVLVHFFDPFGGYALAERRSEFGYKLIYDACTMPSVELPFLVGEAEANRRFLAKVRRQELFCLMNADVVIVGSELTRDYVCGLGVTREQVHVLPAPVDLGPYAPAVMGKPDATPMTLIHLGNQGASQDLPTVLEALQLALQTVDVRLCLVGPNNPEHQARLEELVAERKLTGKVDFQPPVAHDDLHKVLATVDVGLLTLSDVERNSRVGSPLSRLGEYLAAGRPVIAADVASARAQLPEDGVVLYRPADAASLADAIVSLATDPARRVKLGAAARRGVTERDAAKVRADLAAIYVGLSGTGVRAVGDEDAQPDEVTQLGAASVTSDTSKQRRAPTPDGDSSPGTGKVTTDPAIAASEDTNPEVEAGASRPAVMGVPLRDAEPPPQLGPEAQEMARALAEQVTTEPNAVRPTDPPVVMGSPLPRPAAHETAGPTPGDLAAELGEVAASASRAAPPTDDGELPPPVTAPAPPPSAPSAEAPAAAAVAPEPPVEELPSVMGVAEAATSDDMPAVMGVEEAPPPLADEEAPAVMGTMDAASLPDEPAPVIPYLTIEPLPPIAAPAPVVPPLAELAPPRTPAATNPLEALAEDPRRPAAPTTRSSSVALPAQAPAPRPSSLGLEALSTRPSPPGPTAPATGPVPAATSPARPSAVGTDPLTPIGVPPVPGPMTVAPGAVRGASALLDATAGRPASLSGSFPVVPAPAAGGPIPSIPQPVTRGSSPALEALAARKGSASGAFPVLAPPAAPAPVSGTTTSRPSGLLPAPALVARESPPGSPASPVVPPLTLPTQPGSPPSPAESRRPRSGLFPVAPQVPGMEEAEAIDEDEIVSDDGESESDVHEISEDEVLDVPEVTGTELEDEPPLMESESISTVDSDASPPPSAIDPWLAQLVHGYCPPEADLFDRHTPPTTMPGRDT